MSEREGSKPPAKRPGGASQRASGGPEILQAPWRDEYLKSLGAEEKSRLLKEGAGAPAGPPGAPGAAGAPGAGAACFLTEYWRRPDLDAQNHVIARIGEGKTAGMILLNRYPYANGHLLAALGDARPTLGDYEPEQRAALWRLVDLAAELLERGMEPQGLNIGVNQGRAAGAGVPEHLHAHLVPRWHGDVNYMTVIGNVRVNPSALDAVAERLREVWRRMEEEERRKGAS